MRKLNRQAVAAPACLARYQHGRDNWDDLSKAPTDKDQIREKLEALQGKRCAYCEGSLDEFGHHIEHFRTRSAHPTLTFAWHNLYWSCDHEECCGRHKDSRRVGSYLPADLVDPCVDDPDHFFRFRTDGSITIRSGLSPVDRRRAEETLRVFNLNPDRGRLRTMRRQIAEEYLSPDPGIAEALMSFDEADRQAFIKEELDRTAGQPFSTVIRHLFVDLS